MKSWTALLLRGLCPGRRCGDFGAAFQKVNFLRDLAEDREDLAHAYLPVFTEEMRDEIVADIREDLDAARLSIPLLPFGARTGVRAATDLYGCLVDNLESASLEDLKNGRIRVPSMKKSQPGNQSNVERSVSKMTKAVVIGGGVAGLATTALLLREGYEVHLVEQNEHLGGRAGTFELDGFRWDTGPSWYLMPDAMSHFFKLCGTSIDDHLDIDAMAELFESREPGAGAKLRTYIDSATQVYNLAIDGFLYTNFTNFIPYLSPGMLRLLPKLLASLSTSLKVKVNTQFRDTKLRQILSYPAVFLSSDPSHTPALYHLMSHTDLVQGVSYPRGGFTAFIKALISLIDDAVLHLGTPVSAITTQGRNATGVQVGSEFIEADIVIS